MDLWIRSQDRETIMQISRVDYSDGHVVAYQPGDDDEILVGTYESKERALEVLDEIQEIIIYNKIFKVDSNAFVKTLDDKKLSKDEQSDLLWKMCVYPMPKE